MSDLKSIQLNGEGKMTNQQEHIVQLENTITELQSENKKLRKIIALSEDNNKTRWVKPKKRFFGDKHG